MTTLDVAGRKAISAGDDFKKTVGLRIKIDAGN